MIRAREKLKKLRNKAGLSGRKFASIIDVPWSTYSSWEQRFKKEYFPMEVVEKLYPTLISHGVDAEEIWDLAGINPDLLKIAQSKDISVTLSDGRVATGMPAEIYATPNEKDPHTRPLKPGLLVIAEIKTAETKEIRAFKLGLKNRINTLIPFDEAPDRTTRETAYFPKADWYEGKFGTNEPISTYRILLVVRELTLQCNTEAFE